MAVRPIPGCYRPAVSTPPDPVPHSLLEDVLGLATGVVLASLGLHLLQSAAAVTGGTAGLSLLTSYATGLPFEALFVAVNVPFFVLAIWKKGWRFTVRSLGCVVAVSLLTGVHERLLDTGAAPYATGYAVVLGNLLAGVGLLIVFRHGASLGGFNVLALLLQERVGLRAGYVQMGLDVAVVLAAAAVVPPEMVGLSALGAVVLNVILAFNHRPGRYLGI